MAAELQIRTHGFSCKEISDAAEKNELRSEVKKSNAVKNDKLSRRVNTAAEYVGKIDVHVRFAKRMDTEYQVCFEKGEHVR